MKKIQMVDLATQYQKIKPEIDKKILEVIETTAFINGPAVTQFQANLEKYLQVKHVVPCANGTDALQIAMMALNLQPGDEIITTAFTFIATAEVINLLRLQPVFADVDPNTFNIDPKNIEKLITPKSKAIVPVHLYGQCADMESIMAIAKKHNLFVIEDACQAIGADYTFADGTTKKAGTIGHIGCVSFFPSKNLGCFGDGGAIFTNDSALAKKMKVIVNHGMDIRYYHDEVGVNSRLDSIQAAVLDIKLNHLDEYIKARQKAAAFYTKALSVNARIKTPAEDPKSTHVYHQYTLKIEGIQQFEIQKYLNDKGIPAMIYYPVPLHLQKAYAFLGHTEGDLPITEMLCTKVLSLPMHTELDEEQLSYITTAILEYLK